MKIETVKLAMGDAAANSYLIDTNDGILVIDCGARNVAIQNALDRMGNKCKWVLLTHGHFDHCNSCKYLQDNGAKVYVHDGDKHMLLSEKNLGYLAKMKIEHCTPDESLKEGQEFEFGDIKVKVIETPGHTPGGVCFVIENCVFTGDTLFLHDYGRTDLEGSSEKQLQYSLKKLFKLPKDTIVYSGHGKTTTIGDEIDYYNEYGKRAKI